MAKLTDVLELGPLRLVSGEARRLDLEVELDPLEFAGERYEPRPGVADVKLDVARTTSGYSLRLRYATALTGPCARCLERAEPTLAVDAREIDQPGADDELSSPYVEDDALDLHGWARDALVLALPLQIVCSEQCRGLCAVCGENLNRADPDHHHEPPPDPRWAKLSELRLG